VAGGEAKEACGMDQLCAGLKADVEGGMHAMQHLWAQHLHDEDWGFLLIDARNAFNELNWTAMLWAVRHEWPPGGRFACNCHGRWLMLVLRDNKMSLPFFLEMTPAMMTLGATSPVSQ
jgi:hypothetical protein